MLRTVVIYLNETRNLSISIICYVRGGETAERGSDADPLNE